MRLRPPSSSIATRRASGASLRNRSAPTIPTPHDILQDTFIALAEALPFFRGDSSLFTFACAIAHRKVLSFTRVNARRARLTLSASQGESMHQPSNDQNLGGSRDFDDAFAELRPEYREVLLLKYVEEVSVAEIARVLKLREHAVESRLARARKALRKRLEESR